MENYLLQKLYQIFSTDRVLTDDQSKSTYAKDLTSIYSLHALAVVFPLNTDELIALIRLAHTNKIILVPSGGRTGYSGGAVANANQIVVSFEKMNCIKNFNPIDQILYCEAGVTLKTIQTIATQNSLYYPIDFASAPHCQIGGNVATNAGGVHVIRYGNTRHWVMGLTVVTGLGEILSFNHGLSKNAAGYDLQQLFIGSEGTLGFITEVIVKLTKIPENLSVILLGISDKKYLSEIFKDFKEKINLHAFEFFSNIALQSAIDKNKLSQPFSNQKNCYALIEYESSKENKNITKNIIKKNKELVDGHVLSENKNESKKLWQYRKLISASLADHSPYKFDIAVLSSKIAEFMCAIDMVFKNSPLKIVWFGHFGDGNIHLNILKPDEMSSEKFLSQCEKISKEVYSIIHDFNGTISAEHGIGLLKKQFLQYSKTKTEINYMKQIKKIFDPNNIMNPGKLIDHAN